MRAQVALDRDPTREFDLPPVPEGMIALDIWEEGNPTWVNVPLSDARELAAALLTAAGESTGEVMSDLARSLSTAYSLYVRDDIDGDELHRMIGYTYWRLTGREA